VGSEETHESQRPRKSQEKERKKKERVSLEDPIAFPMQPQGSHLLVLKGRGNQKPARLLRVKRIM